MPTRANRFGVTDALVEEMRKLDEQMNKGPAFRRVMAYLNDETVRISSAGKSGASRKSPKGNRGSSGDV